MRWGLRLSIGLMAMLAVAFTATSCGRIGFSKEMDAGMADAAMLDGGPPDAGMDAAADAGVDAPADSGLDAPEPDGGPADGGMDAGPLPDDVVFDWSRSYGGDGLDSAFAVAVARDGQVVVAGVFQNTLDLGVPTRATSVGRDDIFVAAFSPDGDPRWLHGFGSAGADQAVGLTVDPDGDVLLTGAIAGTVDFGTGPLMNAGQLDAVVVRFRPDGSTRWARRIGGPGLDGGFNVLVDPSGDIFAVGAFESSVLVGTTTLNSMGTRDAYLVRYDPDGGVRWARSYGGPGPDIMLGLTQGPGGDLFTAGSFSGTSDFGMGPMIASGPSDVFAARYAPDGTARWTRRYGGAGDDQGTRIAATPDGIVVGGTFEGTVDFGTGARVSAGMHDGFIAGYGLDASPRWSVRFGSTEEDAVNSVAADRGGNAYATGRFEGVVDFGDGIPVSGFGGWDTYVASYSPTGVLRWVHTFDGTNNDTSNSVTVGPAGDVTFAGGFAGTIDFGGGPHTAMLGDLFVVHFAPSP